MTYIGRKIINKKTLMICEANRVYRDLDTLETTGVWDRPKWATELKNHYGVVECAHPVIILAGWRAVSRAYHLEIVR